MDIETRDRWSAELRSGRYVKITTEFTDGCDGRCMLGVLGEVYGLDLSVPQPVFDALHEKGINAEYFYKLNDNSDLDLSFSALADRIDALPIDDEAFQYKD